MNSSLVQFWEHFKEEHVSIENSVSDSFAAYKGHSVEALYTSPDDLMALFKSPFIKGSFTDLGCGTGFTAILYGSLFPDREASGIEFQERRLLEGQKYITENKLQNVTLMKADLMNCEIPVRETYFLYFPTGPVLDRILSELYRLNHPFNLIVIESHGDLLKRIELENWLSLKEEVPLKSSRHYPHARIYERNFSRRHEMLLAFEHSYQDHFITVETNGETWLACTRGMEWSEGDRFELQTPPRTVFWKDVKKLILSLEECPSMFHEAIKLWDKGEVRLFTPERVFQGLVRKIIISPSFKVEISSGEKVEWSEIYKITSGI